MKRITAPSVKLGTWFGYSGMAATFLAISPKAEAQVIANDLEPDVLLVNDTLAIDFDNDGVVDMNLSDSHGSFLGSNSFNSWGMARAAAPHGQLLASTEMWEAPRLYPSLLATGAPIAPGDPNFCSLTTIGTLAWRQNFQNSVGNHGNFYAQSGHFGCRFTAGDGATHYAWVELGVSELVASVTVMGYGYETVPDVAINAGDMGHATDITDGMANALHMDIKPNPTTGRAVISLPKTHTPDMRISLLNSMGQILFTQKVGNLHRYTLNLSAQAPGIYFVRLRDGKRVVYSKVAKQ